MTCHWMIGMQECTPCPLCGLMTVLGASNLRRVVGYDFHHLRKKYDVPSMWGNIHPQWRLCSSIWKRKGLVGTRSLREKSGFLPTGLIGLRGVCGVLLPAPPLEFPGEQGMFTVPTCMPKFERKNKSFLS